MKKILLLLLLPFTLLGQKQAVVHINTDAYPSETYWIIMKDSLYGDTIAEVQAGHYTSANSSFTDTVTIADSIDNVTFLIRDTYGDGIMSPGSFYFSICEDTVLAVPTPNFNSGMYWNRSVPNCMPNPPPSGPCNPMLVNINLDQFQSETTWDIKDTMGNVLFSGGPYTNAPDYEPQFISICAPLGPLNFTIYDSYGDGLAGSLWQGNDGSYFVMQCGDTLVYGTTPNFGNSATYAITSDTCTPPPPVPGCMDENYLEFDPAATANDSSCTTLKILGCVDTTMFNYDSTANHMDYIDSCDYTLTLLDHGGNGWVGSRLEIYQEDTTQFVMTSGFSQTYNIELKSPDLVEAKFFITAQASNTASECGFVLTGPLGDTVIYVSPHFMTPFFVYSGTTNCGNECVEKVVGCMDSLANNYDSTANIDTFCYYVQGCMSPAYLEYHVDTSNGVYTDFNVQDSCNQLAIFGCTDFLSFNYDSSANVNVGGCVPVVLGCMNPLAFNYDPNANVDDSCVTIIYGCTNILAFNYDSLANTDDGSCIAVVLGCTDSTMWNYSPSANLSDSSCVPYIFGCMDVDMFNYNALANTDNGSCIAFVYGCIDSTMFNFNPLANADNNSCIAYIYGCTDPSALNYNTQANTEDFSCIAYVYGCTDTSSLNFDSLANTDNGSCIQPIMGCMDQTAYNYDQEANVNDSASCNYSANCITGPGLPYWLNDPCYAWVIDVDEYCCENEWDQVCQATYDYCEGTWIGPLPKRFDRKLIAITDILGRPVTTYNKQLLFYIYDDGSVEKKYMK